MLLHIHYAKLSLKKVKPDSSKLRFSRTRRLKYKKFLEVFTCRVLFSVCWSVQLTAQHSWACVLRTLSSLLLQEMSCLFQEAYISIHTGTAYFKVSEKQQRSHIFPTSGGPCESFNLKSYTLVRVWSSSGTFLKYMSVCYVFMWDHECAVRLCRLLRGEPELPTVSGSQLRPCCCWLQWAWLKPSLGWFRGK